MRYFLILLVPGFYFYMSWFFPWNLFEIKSTISITYLFDIIFSAIVIYFTQKKLRLGDIREFIPQSILVLIAIFFAVLEIFLETVCLLIEPFFEIFIKLD